MIEFIRDSWSIFAYMAFGGYMTTFVAGLLMMKSVMNDDRARGGIPRGFVGRGIISMIAGLVGHLGLLGLIASFIVNLIEHINKV